MSGSGSASPAHTLLTLLLVLSQISKVRRSGVMIVIQSALSSLVLVLLTKVSVLARTRFYVAGYWTYSRLFLPCDLILVLRLSCSHVVKRDLCRLLTMASRLGQHASRRLRYF